MLSKLLNINELLLATLVLEQFDKTIGLEKLQAIHLNDSLTPYASQKDRHARIGEGAGDMSRIDPQTLLTEQAQRAIADQFARFGTTGQEMYYQLLHAVKESLAAGISNLFKVGLVFAVLCFIGTFFLPERTLQGDEYYSDAKE